MTKKMNSAFSTLILAALFIFGSTAFADTLNLNLTNPVQSGAPGSTLSYTATVSAPVSNGAAIFLNGDNFNVDVPLSLNDDGFFFNFPLSLDPGESVSDVLFTVDLPANAGLGSYNGFFEILGGSDGSALDVLSSASFQANVASSSVVPEPSSVLLLATGLLGLALMIDPRAAIVGRGK